MNRWEHKCANLNTDDGIKDLVVGRQAVLETIRFGKPQGVFLAKGLKGTIINEIILQADKRNITIKLLSRRDFEQLVGDIKGHQGVAAQVPPFQYCSLNELIDISRFSIEEPLLIMLDHIEDPQNLGAVMRTANAAGVHGLIIPNRRAALVTTAVRKAAAGAAEHLPVAKVNNLNLAAQQLKRAGFWLYGAEAEGDAFFYRADYKRPLVIVFGSEGKGLSTLLRKNCDLVLTIPMPGSAGSLNVSAAVAVLVFAVLSQREGWLS